MANLYKILQVDANEKAETIEKSYLKLKKEAEEASEDTSVLDQAFSILCDPSKRQTYDLGLAASSTTKSEYAVGREQEFSNVDLREPWEIKESDPAYQARLQWQDLSKKIKNALQNRPPIGFYLSALAWWIWPIFFSVVFLLMVAFDINPLPILAIVFALYILWKRFSWAFANSSSSSN